MKNNLVFWKKKLRKGTSRSKAVFFLIGFLLVFVCVAGGGWYMKKVNDEKLAAEMEQQNIKRIQSSITSFYSNAFAGVDLNELANVMREFDRSREPLSIVGFKETEYKCSNKLCQFLYELNDMFVFSVTEKKFFNTNYEGSFTENTLNFDNLMIESKDSEFFENMNSGVAMKTVKCNDILNYLYGYNSIVEQPYKVKVTRLPFSSVESAEQQFPLYKDSYGLMTGEFEVRVADDFSDVYLFVQKNPYKNSFIVQNIEKSVKTGPDIILKGVFVCKK